MTRRLVLDVADRPHKLVLRCYACERSAEVEEGPGFVRHPLNWTKDANGNDRCPRHSGVESERRFVTLGDLIEAKKQRRSA